MSYKILLVEDSPTQAMRTRFMLESEGFGVLQATDGKEALSIARRERPDVILSDILMPGMDGFQLTQEVRADPELSAVPVVLVTSTYKTEEDRIFGVRAGADAFIEKLHLTPESLASVLHAVITQRQEQIRPPEEAIALDEDAFREQHTERLLNKLLQEVEALEQANLMLQQRVAELEVNLQTARTLSSSLDTQAIWRTVAMALEQVISWDVCALLLTDPPKMRIQPHGPVTPEAAEMVKSDLWQAVTNSAEASIALEGIQVEAEEPLAGRGSTAAYAAGMGDSIRSSLMVQGETIGVLGLYRFVDGPFSEDDQRTLATTAAQAAIAFENARLYAAQERRARDMETLYYITSSLTRTLDLQATLDEVVLASLELVEGDSGSVMLFDPESQALRLVASRGLDAQIVERASRGVQTGFAWRVFESRRALLTQDAVFGSQLAGVTPRREAASSIAVPLLLEDEVIGVLGVNSMRPERPFTHAEMVAMSHLAVEAAAAINQARLHNALVTSYDATLEALVGALELRDIETEGHTWRVLEYALTLADKLGVDEEVVTEIERGALLHDLGKIGVPDKILHKPGPLSEVEWILMRAHPQMGYQMLSGIEFLQRAAEMVLTHHERWDGGGYPRGLRGEVIPQAARIFAVADAIDAITSDRPYRDGQPFEVAFQELVNMRGTQFDPAIVDAALEIMPDEWLRIRAQVEEERRKKRVVISGEREVS